MPTGMLKALIIPKEKKLLTYDYRVAGNCLNTTLFFFPK